MANKKKISVPIVVAISFIIYGAVAARPVLEEPALAPRWISSLNSEGPTHLSEQAPGFDGRTLPFAIGGRFGYVAMDGELPLNRPGSDNAWVSADRWAEFDPVPDVLTVNGADGSAPVVIDNPGGYPFFLAGRTFVMGRGQDSVSRFSDSGERLWTFDFPGIVTVVDASEELLAVGTLDGQLVVVDDSGRQVFAFEPGGSRLSLILGLALSDDGSRIGLISGLDSQRFLLLERLGGGQREYRVVYHEFVGEGFRRPVQIVFLEGDRRLVFERPGGLGIYDTALRRSSRMDIPGELVALDGSGGRETLFAVFGRPDILQMELLGIRIGGIDPVIIISAPFKSGEVFLGRVDERLILGNSQALVAFDLEKR
ncbi:MAG: WD40 repeat domain-containing protein [Treponema sp.]|nr:WD40 repeat domain-containing protein [Treponema sp.]